MAAGGPRPGFGRCARATFFRGNFLFRSDNFFIASFGINGRVIVVIIAQFGTFGCGTKRADIAQKLP